MPYRITQCYLPPDRGDIPAFTPNRSWYSIKRPRRDARLSWTSWLMTYRDGIPARRRSSIQVLTGSDVHELRSWDELGWPLRHAANLVHIGWNDVTESIITIRSPFCGYNTTQFVELNGENLSCHWNKTESVSLRKCPYDHWLTYEAYWKSLLHQNAYPVAKNKNKRKIIT